jgi:hemerythrin-like domain-containing protein
MTALITTPSADFDHPIDMLDGCHERILRNCATIERLAGHIATDGADTEARLAAVGVLRYFDTAAAHHHRDEEDDLFPALVRNAPSKELDALLDRLRADHERLAALWSDMHARLTHVAEGRDGGLTAKLAADLTAAYAAHIALEEAELLPLARRVLDDYLMRAIGDHMAERRGLVRRAA